METKGRRFGFGAGLFGFAGVLGLYAGGALVAAVILLLALAVPAWSAALIVAAVIAVVALVMAAVAREHVRRASPPAPQQAVSSIRQDIETVREGARR
jgi:MFS family permease